MILLPMARFNKNKQTFVRDSFDGEMLEEGVDSVYNVGIKHHLVDGQGKKHYLTLPLVLSHESVLELLLNKIPPKNIRWLEWLPPTEEDKAEAQAKGRQAFGDSIPYKGAIE